MDVFLPWPSTHQWFVSNKLNRNFKTENLLLLYCGYLLRVFIPDSSNSYLKFYCFAINLTWSLCKGEYTCTAFANILQKHRSRWNLSQIKVPPFRTTGPVFGTNHTRVTRSKVKYWWSAMPYFKGAIVIEQ